MIVSSLGFERREAREVLQVLRARCPETPLIIEVAPGQEGEWWDFLEGCDAVVSPVSPDQLVAAVRRALAKDHGDR